MAWSAAAAVVSAAVSYAGAQKQASATKNAADQATQNAAKQAALQEQALNKANAKSPNTGAITSGNQQAALGGAGSTMLTGPAGVDANTISLGKSTLLGN